jgi:excisionase family DNA binding protein
MTIRSIDEELAEQTQEPKNEADLLTVPEVAQYLRVDDSTVRRWVKNGALEAVVLPHVGDRQIYRIRRSTLEKLLS